MLEEMQTKIRGAQDSNAKRLRLISEQMRIGFEAKFGPGFMETCLDLLMNMNDIMITTTESMVLIEKIRGTIKLIEEARHRNDKAVVLVLASQLKLFSQQLSSLGQALEAKSDRERLLFRQCHGLCRGQVGLFQVPFLVSLCEFARRIMTCFLGSHDIFDNFKTTRRCKRARTS